MRNTRYKGIFLADFLTSIVLLGLIIMILATSMNGFSKFNHYQWARQRCMAAATAQLDSITATGLPIEEQELQRLWPYVSVTVDRSPVAGRWDGLELVEVTAATQEVKVRLVRYIQPTPIKVTGNGWQRQADPAELADDVSPVQEPSASWRVPLPPTAGFDSKMRKPVDRVIYMQPWPAVAKGGRS